LKQGLEKTFCLYPVLFACSFCWFFTSSTRSLCGLEQSTCRLPLWPWPKKPPLAVLVAVQPKPAAHSSCFLQELPSFELVVQNNSPTKDSKLHRALQGKQRERSLSPPFDPSTASFTGPRRPFNIFPSGDSHFLHSAHLSFRRPCSPPPPQEHTRIPILPETALPCHKPG
jgi:hypothetical protein